MPGIRNINPFALSVADFKYHASPFGTIFGKQPIDSMHYQMRYPDEDLRLQEPDPYHNKPMFDMGPGFYLSNDIVDSYAWGARFPNATPVLNIFDVPGLHGNGLVLDVFNNKHDLLFWLVSISRNRPKEGRAVQAYQMLAQQYDRSLQGVDWILAPRSDDSVWRFAHSYLNGDITTEAFYVFIDELSAGYQLVLRTPAAIGSILFEEYEPYAVGQYPQHYKDNNIAGYEHFLELLHDVDNLASVHPEKESLDDILGLEKYRI